MECRICKLILISAPQLARSLHNLLPLPAFEEIDTAEGYLFIQIHVYGEKFKEFTRNKFPSQRLKKGAKMKDEPVDLSHIFLADLCLICRNF